MKGKIQTGGSTGIATALSYVGGDSAYNISANAIQINWTLSTDTNVAAYNVYLLNSDNSLTLIGSANASTALYVHSGLTSGTLYRYVVRSAASDGTTDTNTKSLMAIPYAGIGVVNVADATSVDMYFPAASEASNLKIYCATGASSTMNLIDTINANTMNYHLSGLTTGQEYTCKVKALLPDGTEDYNSNAISFTPQAVTTSPLGFAGITSATNTNGTSALIQWAEATPDSGVTVGGYRVYKTNPDSSVEYNDVAANLTSYTFTDLIPGNNYSFFVRAINAADSSTDGNSVKISVFTYEGITSATASSPTSALLTFPSAPNASALNIYCYLSTDNVPSTPTASITSDLTTYTISTLTTGSNYICLVKAVGSSGEDSNTATSAFTTP